MKVGLSLGANLGNRLEQLQAAKSFLVGLSTGGWHQASPLYETVPVDCPPNSPAFLNAVIEIEYARPPRDLLEKIKIYEDAQGRDRNLPKNAARKIDIDMLYCGDLKITEPDLVVPHPRMLERRFVLMPLSKIRPDLELPAGIGEVRFVQQEW
ncbi:MAG: 2-amino-4-hydroxy-6-hydroxymethyldihydropteridine pyrophosphokinase [Verrucomicrobiae bacterium]|nr:2-amino-4-hydroxy-6-hydroxymethyldihydropteridine pyrophosphokinase [Verrucomicrobiae bacterium]